LKRWITGSVAVAALLVGGSIAFLRSQGIPVHAMRRGAPTEIALRALAVGALAPDMSLPAADRSTWRLSDALRGGPAVLLFYRGHW
jgi:AhpC/TSA family